MAPTPSTSTTTTQSTQANQTSGNPLNPNTCRDHTDKWVINLSRTPLTVDQLTLLQKGPNFAITPKYPPIDAYIMATELASSKLPSQEVDEFRSDVNRLLKEQQQQHHNNCNLNPAQCRALTQLKQDNTRVVLTADKGVAMVIMDQQDYNTKAKALLQDTNTYKVLPKDPTPALKNKLINLLKDIKQSGGLSIQKYKQLYPTSAVPHKFYGLSKIHKTGTPLRPIVSSRGSITYGVAKELSHIIKSLVGQLPHHLKNTQHFIQQLQGKRLQAGESITSFDVKALFTSVPVQPSIHIVQNRLQQDTTLPQRTSMSIPQIISLLEFCLTHTCFLFQGKYYEQVQGAAMGSPISPLIANIFMEEFEVKAFQSFPHPPSLWLRFVDDTFVINKAEDSQDLLQHINSQDPHIQFTMEPTQQGSLPFLDTLVTIQPHNTFNTTIYRKPTHTDQYLHWDSNHHITAKQSVYNTLAHRAKTVSSTQDNLKKELTHIKTALHHCQFPSWALKQWEHKFNQTQPLTAQDNSSNNNSNSSNSNKYKATIVVPYINKTAEKFKRLCKNRGIQVHFRGTNTLRTALGNPKDKDPKANQTGIIYKYQCPHIQCTSSYIGESGRSLGERVKEHFKTPSPIHHHSTTTGHPMDPNQFNIVHKEVNSLSRTIKEAMFICIQDPPLNRNLGKYQLPHIWDNLLQASPMFQHKPTPQPTTNT